MHNTTIDSIIPLIDENESSNSNIQPSTVTVTLQESSNKHNITSTQHHQRIDFVLVYDDEEDDQQDVVVNDDNKVEALKKTSDAEKNRQRRAIFENRLREQGFELEIKSATFYESTKFVLIYAPYKVLAIKAELMQLRKPIRRNDLSTSRRKRQTNICQSNCFKLNESGIDDRISEADYFSAPFVVQREHLFINNDDCNHEQFFTDAERIMMVYDTLIRTEYDAIPIRHTNNPLEDAKYHVGVDRMVATGAYTCAYPLHEGEFRRLKPQNLAECNDRELLYHTWVCRFFKYQPLPLIKKYYGSKIAMYFGWLGFYTKTLIAPAFIGILVIIYGIVTVSSDIPSKDVCESDNQPTTSIIMCPSCEILCDFWRLSESCDYAKLTHIFDNISTVIYAAFMSIWATLFLEGFKRYHAELAWEWDLLDLEKEEDTIRPEYQYRVTTLCENPITGELEPFLSDWERVLRLFGSGVTVAFSLLLVLAFVAGIIVYQVILVSVFYQMENLTSYAVILASVMSAILNLIAIRIMNCLYISMADHLTNWERPRTQTDYDNSYTFKVFLFQFINYYSSLFYIAFIKGRVSGVPDNESDYRMRIFGYELEPCNPAGCMVELVIQLAVIMVGDQFLDGFMEILYPIITNSLRRCVRRLLHYLEQRRLSQQIPLTVIENNVEMTPINVDTITSTIDNARKPRWERDLMLNTSEIEFLCDEYLELVMQFGFVTLFVAAFPLAPLFALINNVIEIRVDGYKLVVATRRPIPTRAKDIGIWLPILDGVSKLAVISNACVIAFTSEFIPKIIYTIQSPTGNLNGYVDDSFAYYYNASKIAPIRTAYPNVTECRFFGYRKTTCHNSTLSSISECDHIEYGFSPQWWQVLAVRFAFILIFVVSILFLFLFFFQSIVFVIKAIMAYLIPDMSNDVYVKLQRERYLARKARLNEEIGECDIRSTFVIQQTK